MPQRNEQYVVQAPTYDRVRGALRCASFVRSSTCGRTEMSRDMACGRHEPATAVEPIRQATSVFRRNREMLLYGRCSSSASF